MRSAKVKVLLSVLLVFLFCLPSFSVLSSAAEINASAYAISLKTVASYYLGSGGVISERYVSTKDQTLSSFPADITVSYDYPDADRKATFMIFDVTFTDDDKFYNTDYTLKFNVSNAVHCYSYIMNLPDIYTNGVVTSDLILAQTSLAFVEAAMSRNVGSVYRYPTTMNNDIRNTFTNNFGSDFFDYVSTDYQSISSSVSFSSTFHIPQNQTMLYYLKTDTNLELSDSTPSPRTLRFFLYFYQSSGSQSSLKLTDFTLVPVNGTELYYQDDVFQNDVIGSDEEGNESGIKGIISYLKNLPSKIIDKLNALFILSDQFLLEYYNSFDQFLFDHFGVLYQAPREIVRFLDYLLLLDAPFFENIGDYKFRLPHVTLYINTEPPAGQDIIYSDIDTDYQGQANLSTYEVFEILPDNSVGSEDPGYYLRLDFLGKRPYFDLYNVYRIFSYASVVVVFLLYCYRRFNAVMGGLS